MDVRPWTAAVRWTYETDSMTVNGVSGVTIENSSERARYASTGERGRTRLRRERSAGRASCRKTNKKRTARETGDGGI